MTQIEGTKKAFQSKWKDRDSPQSDHWEPEDTISKNQPALWPVNVEQGTAIQNTGQTDIFTRSPESIVCTLRNWTHFRTRLLTGQWIDTDTLHLLNSRNPPPSRAASAWYSTNQDERRDWVRTRRSRATAPSIVTLSHGSFLLWGKGPERASEMDRIGYIKRGQSKPHRSAYQRRTGVQCHHQHVGAELGKGAHTKQKRWSVVPETTSLL